MEYRPFGRSGLRISALSFGSYVTFANQLDLAGAKELLQAAYAAGVNFFDNAEAYAEGESERIMGRAIAELGWPRDSYLVSSKVFFGATADPGPTQRGLHKKHIVEACHQALERLRVDYLDLYFCHRPDPETPIEATVRAMDDLVRQGKVLYWGTSEWSPRDIREAFAVAELRNLTPPTMEQPQYNMLNPARVEVEYAPLFERFGLGTTTWAPLRSGVLTGKYRDEVPSGTRLEQPGYVQLREHLASEAGRPILQAVAELGDIARGLDTSMPRLAIAWCLKNPNVSSVILGASRLEQLEENLAALPVVERLGPQVMARIERVLAGLPGRARRRASGWRRLFAPGR